MGHKTSGPENSDALPLGGPSGAAATADRDYLQIGEVAEQTGLTQRTLRYYEELQLLDPPTRMAGGFRLYSPADVARVRQIVRLKQLLGFSLAEIKQIVGAQEAQERLQTTGSADARQRLEQLDSAIATAAAQLDLLRQKIAQMELLRTDLAARLESLQQRRAALVAEHEGALLHAASEYS